MNFRNLFQYSLFIILVLGFLLFIRIPEKVAAQQAQPRFLQSPYYSNKYLISWFDHEVPTYGINQNLVIYTGDERGVPDNSLCTPGWYGNCYDGHPGIDFSTGYEQILAAADGIVSWAEWPSPQICHNGPSCDLGLHVIIQHSRNNMTYQTIYGHLSTTAVQVGDIIKVGHVIGSSGSTGNSTGPHLHFEVRIYLDGQYRRIDPFGWQPPPDTDPWAGAVGGAASWCMWSGGQWASICDANQPNRPVPTPHYFSETIIDDNANNNDGFYKGYGGLFSNYCTGSDPACQKWWSITWTGYAGDAYRTIASENLIPSNWAAWSPTFSDYYTRLYEIFVYTPDLNSEAYPKNTFTWQAKYHIIDAYGLQHTAIVDQYVGDGQNYNPYNQWRSIGMYRLNSSSFIYVTDATGETADMHCPDGPAWPNGSTQNWCRLLVDGVKIAQVQRRVFLPLIQNHLPMANDPPSGTPSPTPTHTPTPTPPTPYP